MKNHVMLDIECLGNSPETACIVQIGAAYFNPHTGDISHAFSVNVSPINQKGAVLEGSTVMWWLDQSKEAQNAVFKNEQESLSLALLKLNDFLEGVDCIWSHATYDFVIIVEAFKREQIKPKFSYKNGMDIRTLKYLSGLEISQTREGVHHNALDDVKFQIKYVVEMLRKLNEKSNPKN